MCNAPLALTAASLEGARIGVPRRGFWQPLEASVKRAAAAPEAALVTLVALVTLAQAGAVLVACDVGVNEGDCSQAGMVIAFTETLACQERYLTQHGLPFDPVAITAQVASADVKGIFSMRSKRRGQPRTENDHTVQVQRPALKKRPHQLLCQTSNRSPDVRRHAAAAVLIGEDDTVVFCAAPTPSLTFTPTATATATATPTATATAKPTFPIVTRYVGAGSVASLPGISLPLGCNPSGLLLSLALAVAVQALIPPMPAPSRFPTH